MSTTKANDLGFEVKDFGGVLGRALVATRTFEIGDFILRDDAIVVASRDRDEKSPPPVKLEKLVKAVAATHTDVDLPTELTVNLLVAFAERASKPDGAEFLQKVDDFARPDVAENLVWLHPITDALATKAKQFLPDMFAALTAKQIADILMINATNAHSFESEEGRFVGLYPLGSKLAHSCAPNALQVFKNTTLEHYALRKIEPGEMIAINYGFSEDIRSVYPTYLRRARLEVSKFFICRCKRCVAPDTNRILRCPKCKEAAVVMYDFAPPLEAPKEGETGDTAAAVATGTSEEPAKAAAAAEEPAQDAAQASQKLKEPDAAHPWLCGNCSAVLTDDDMPLLAEQELSESIAQLADYLMTPDTDRTKLYEAVELCSKTSDEKLGPEHWISGWSILLLLSDSRNRPQRGKSKATDAAYNNKRRELAKRWYRWSRQHVYPYFPHYFTRMLASSLSDILDDAAWQEMVSDPQLDGLEQYILPQFVGPVFGEERLKAIKDKIAAARQAVKARAIATAALDEELKAESEGGKKTNKKK